MNIPSLANASISYRLEVTILQSVQHGRHIDRLHHRRKAINDVISVIRWCEK